MAIKIKNNAKSTLLAGITAVDTTLSVASGEGSKFPTLGKSDYFYLTLVDQADDTIFEVVKVTAITGDSFTISRAEQGTTALAFNASDFAELRVTKKSILNLTEDKLYYDALPAPLGESADYPFGNADSVSERFLGLMRDNYFGKLKAEYRNITTGVITSDLEFADFSELQTWVDNNVGNDGTNFTETGYFYFYDIVDKTIQKMTKGYGLNSVFSSMSGRKYKSHNGTAINGNFFNDLYADAFNSMVTELGGAFVPALVAGDFDANGRSAVWLPKTVTNYNKGLVQTPTWSSIIDFSNGYNMQRYFFTDGTNTKSAVNDGTDPMWKVVNVRMYSIDTNNSTFNQYDRTHGGRYKFAKDIRDGRRYITVYLLQSTNDVNKFSIMAKPLGIDLLSTDYVDYSQYDLEIVSINKTDSYTIQKTHTSAPNADNDIGSGRQKLYIQDWLPGVSNVSKSNQLYGSHERYYFRLRDKVTKKVSQLSSFYIYNIGVKKYNSRNTFGYAIGTDKK